MESLDIILKLPCRRSDDGHPTQVHNCFEDEFVSQIQKYEGKARKIVDRLEEDHFEKFSYQKSHNSAKAHTLQIFYRDWE